MFFSILSIENDEDRNRMVEIYESYAPYVYKCISDYSVEWHKRDDVSQEVFKRLIENTVNIVALQDNQLLSYIWHTVRSVVFSMFKKEQRYKMESLESLKAEDDFDVPDRDAPPVYEDLEETENKARIMSVMNRLPEQERDILVYKYFMTMSDTKIADTLKVSPNSVRVYVMRARNHLIELWKRSDQCDE